MNETTAPRELVAFVAADAGSVRLGGVVSSAALPGSLLSRTNARSASAASEMVPPVLALIRSPDPASRRGLCGRADSKPSH